MPQTTGLFPKDTELTPRGQIGLPGWAQHQWVKTSPYASGSPQCKSGCLHANPKEESACRWVCQPCRASNQQTHFEERPKRKTASPCISKETHSSSGEKSTHSPLLSRNQQSSDRSQTPEREKTQICKQNKSLQKKQVTQWREENMNTNNPLINILRVSEVLYRYKWKQ